MVQSADFMTPFVEEYILLAMKSFSILGHVSCRCNPIHPIVAAVRKLCALVVFHILND